MLSVCAEAIVPTTAGWMEWDVTNHVKDAIREGLSKVDILLKFEIENSFGYYIQFNSRESASAPILTLNDGNKSCIKDMYMYQLDPNGHYSGHPYFTLKSQSSSKNIRALVTLDLTGVNSVVNALLKLNLLQISYAEGYKVLAYKLIRSDWEETEATWNSYKTGATWATAGGDYVAEVEDLPAPSGVKQIIFPAKYPRLYP
jgi:hypothetical protein